MFLALVAISCGIANTNATEPPDEYEQDRAAIRAATRDYLRAIEAGDRERVAATWTADGIFIDFAGRSTRGRTLAERLSQIPQPSPQSSPYPPQPSVIRFPTSNVAIEDGQSTDIIADANRDWIGRYTAVWVKRDNRWLLDSVRESQRVKSVPQDFLRALSWLIGHWGNDGGDTQVRVTSRWSFDQNFILREVEILMPDAAPILVSQRIGWDARRRQIRAWTFDSLGGHSDAVLTFQGTQLLLTGNGVTADGEEVMSRNSYMLNTDGSVIWESQLASRDGRTFPVQKMRLVRKPTNSTNPASESAPR